MPYALSFLYRQLFVRLPVPTTSFRGNTFIVTSSNVCLSLETSRWIVRLGACRLSLACRSVEKGGAAAKDIRLQLGARQRFWIWELDMASYDSVQAFASRVYVNLP
jgi:hypothetical protein